MDKTIEHEIPTQEQTDATLMQFVRDRQGQPRGVVIAKKVNGTVRVGWSFSNKKAGDSFNKKRGIDIATGRVYTTTRSKIPNSVNKVIENMVERSTKYFRTDDVFIAGETLDNI